MRSVAEVARLLEAGNLHRAVAAHNLNDHSSRSHAICTLHLEQRRRPHAPPAAKDVPRFLRAKLHLVDLAGPPLPPLQRNNLTQCILTVLRPTPLSLSHIHCGIVT